MNNFDYTKTPPSFEGIFNNWQLPKKQGKGLRSIRWLDRIKSQLDEYRSELKKNSLCSPPRPSDLPYFCNDNNIKSIIDFGGSSGWLWDYIKTTCLDTNIEKYNIIETLEVCDFVKNNSLHKKPVLYNTYENFNNLGDLVYCNSVLQYFDNEEYFLDLIKKSDAKIILLEDLYIGDFDDFYSTQVYYEDRIPVKFRNGKKFLNLFKNLGFSLILIKPYICEHRGIVQPLPMEGFPIDKKIKYSSTVLFKRI